MRARNIKPGFFKNERMADLPPSARLLFIGLWCMADRNGVLENRPRRIAAEIFPYEPETAITVNSLLAHLERTEFIRYITDGTREFIHIPKFLRHQSPHHTERESGLPHPENCAIVHRNGDHGELTVTTPIGNGENPPDSLIPDSLIPDSLIPDSLIPDSLIGVEEEASTAPPQPPVFISLPTNIRGVAYDVTVDAVATASETFPAVDVRQQLRVMRDWLDANPRNRKTKDGMKAFIHNWLKKEQNRAPRSNGTVTVAYKRQDEVRAADEVPA